MQNSHLGQLLVASTITRHPIYAGGVCLVVHEDDEQTIGVMLNRPLQPNVGAMTALLNAGQNDAADDSEDEEEIEDWQLGLPDDSQFAANHSFGDDSEDDQADDWDATGQDSEDGSPKSVNRLEKHFGNGQTPVPDEQTLVTDHQGMTPLGQLHFGGPVSGPVVALHGTSELAEMETGSGIYVAAQRDHLEQLVREHSDQFRLIVGHLRWSPGALQSEVQQGLWHPIDATAEDVFAPAIGMWPRLVRRATSKSLARWIGAADLSGSADWN